MFQRQEAGLSVPGTPSTAAYPSGPVCFFNNSELLQQFHVSLNCTTGEGLQVLGWVPRWGTLSSVGPSQALPAARAESPVASTPATGFQEPPRWMFMHPGLQTHYKTHVVVRLSVPFIISGTLAQSECALRSSGCGKTSLCTWLGQRNVLLSSAHMLSRQASWPAQ